MKRTVLAFAAALCALSLMAQTPKGVKLRFVEGSDLTLVGNLMPDTPNPYHRVDTVIFKGFTKGENAQVRMTSGMSVAFKTNSSIITIRPKFGEVQYPQNSNGIAGHGFDLYIKKDGQWIFAAAAARSPEYIDKDVSLISDMDHSEKECLLYLPLYSELYSVGIGIEEGATIEAIPVPFRHRIAIFGSSYTHGSSTSRPGMTYPAQLSRMTGLQFLSLGCSGNSKLQPYFADVLAAVDADAFVFDGFSNPSADLIKERLFPFIEKIQAAHPGVPLIFQKTIWRESRSFSLAAEKNEAAKMAMADSLMKIACKKYKDVYWITNTDASMKSHDSSVDGVHPTNHGYTLWAESVRKPIVKILKKYGIK